MLTPCERHPEREGKLAISLPSIGIMRYWCQECRDEYDRTHPSKGFGRAFGSGCGPEAAAEQRELKAMQDEEFRGKPSYKEKVYL
jgi:hypothetical protein